ncbi:LacI family DNA-binding transcriptional regulator [Bifidobacterium miconisargentati]|uniref:LacI family DNA-binding transcriptional regulator n=1 Tax=Bifidobacterium miconisargentati TaxID=2834437 RepID=UPI001BDCB087|nr:LacI family DNA-binding transcriptional regulator [Bifidobacterium miconisargentati]MBW3089157.1 LacI family DNA-binding transcriptional regulator [Bifidobacterium miconisargentati]
MNFTSTINSCTNEIFFFLVYDYLFLLFALLFQELHNEHMTSRLDQIAAQAAVSKATVSRVLNERPGVSPQMRRAVLTAIDVLGLERPNGLRPRSSGLVGLILPNLEDPVYPVFAQVVSTNLARLGYTPVLCIQDQDGVGEDEYVGMLLDRGVAGIIFVSGQHADTRVDRSRYDDLVAQRLPIVFVRGYLDDLDVPFVSSDDQAAGELAVRHLAQLGHRRIGLILPSGTNTSALRQAEGYRHAMREEFGADADQWVDISFEGEEGGYAGAIRLLDKEVTGYVCGSDLLALGAIRALRQRGKRVPQDVSVIGYGDSPLMAHTNPPLTTVRQPILSMGTFTAHALINRIQGNNTITGESLFPPELVIRGSTAMRGKRFTSD